MKILLVSSRSFSSAYGGGQVYVRNLIDAFVQQGIHPAIATTAITIDVPSAYKGGPIHTFKVSEGLHGLEKVLLTVKPDIVHAHGYKAQTARICHKIAIPCIITAHHGGFVCPAGALLNERDEICQSPISQKACMPCCLKNWMPGSKIAVQMLRVLPWDLRIFIEQRMRSLPFIPFLTPTFNVATAIEQKIKDIQDIAAHANRVIAPSRAIQAAMVRNGIPTDKILHAPHGIASFKERRFDDSPGKRPVRFAFLGRVNHVKGLHVLFHALELLPGNLPWELHIYGEAANDREKRYQARLQRNAAIRGKVTWHGHVAHEHIGEAMAHCDVLVHPAIYLEVFGLTILESFSVGRPVIVTRCGGPEELVRENIDGYLVPPNDPAALANKLETLLRTPSEITRLSSNIRPVRTLRDHVQDLCDIYKNVL